jgi:hypothetical protein
MTVAHFFQSLNNRFPDDEWLVPHWQGRAPDRTTARRVASHGASVKERPADGLLVISVVPASDVPARVPPKPLALGHPSRGRQTVDGQSADAAARADLDDLRPPFSLRIRAP